MQLLKIWSVNLYMKTETERKIGQVWIQHLEFVRKTILLHDLEKFSLLAQYGCSRLGAGLLD